MAVKRKTTTGEQYERIVEKTLARYGLLTYTRPKVKYHSRDMFYGDVLFIFKNDLYVIQCKRYQDAKAGHTVGKQALLEALKNPKMTNKYFVFVSSPFNQLTIMCDALHTDFAYKLAQMFGGATVETFILNHDQNSLSTSNTFTVKL